MYYKLPIKDRMDLMKSYKKANPKMSYSDMVNDYNTSYQRFDNGGKVEFNSGGETHVVYKKESPTGNGKGVEGHIMVNHPTKDKGKWDTIDLTAITNYDVKTVQQGIASTKQWHKENPEYTYGGMRKFEDGGKKSVPTADNTNVARSYFPNPDNTNMDTRRIPQSGMVVDKRTNQAYYFGDDGDTGTFPVLTAKNPEANKNTYSLSQLAKNSNLRSTPKGYYMVEKESKYKSKDDMQHYKGLMRSLNPIEAYGESKPSASDLALHLTFTDPGNPKVFKNREHLYNEVPQKRYASYGCVNCQEPSYRAFNKAVPESDTLMMLDSKDPKDLRLLKQAQSRIKTKIKD